MSEENIDSVMIQAVLDGAPAPTGLHWRVSQVDVIDPETRWERRHLEDLRDPSITRWTEGPRVTQKKRTRHKVAKPKRRLAG